MSDWEVVQESEWETVDSPNPAASSTGLKGVGQDILRGASEAPTAVWEGAKDLPGELYGAGKQAVTDPKRALANSIAGLGEYGHNLLNFPSNVGGYLSEKELISPETYGSIPRHKEERDYGELLGIEGNKGGDAFFRSLAGLLGVGPAGELGALTGLSRTAARSAAMGLQGAIAGENPVTSALQVPIAELGIKGAGEAFNRARNLDLTPSGLTAKTFGGNIPEEQLRQNQRAAQGTETGLGRVLESPSLIKAQENVLPNVAFSGAEDTLARAAEQVGDRANKVYEDLGEHIPKGSIDANDALRNAIERAHKEQTDLKNKLYEPANKLAQEENFKVDLHNFANDAALLRQALDESPLTLSPKFSSLLQKAIKAENKSNSLPLNEAKQLKGYFYNLAESYKKTSNGRDKFLAESYKDLYKSLAKDEKESLTSKASPKLREEVERADKHFQENYSKWLDKDLSNILESDSETLARDIIKSGKSSDKFSRIQKIQKLLPEKDKNSIGFAYLQQALDKQGNLSPIELGKSIDKIGNRQFRALFPKEETRNKLTDYVQLKKMNEKALHRQANPETGKQALGLLPYAHATTSAATFAANPLLGSLYALGVPAAGKIANKALTSEKFRNKVIDKSINKKETPEKTKKQKDLEENLTLVIPYAPEVAKKKESRK